MKTSQNLKFFVAMRDQAHQEGDERQEIFWQAFVDGWHAKNQRRNATRLRHKANKARQLTLNLNETTI